MGISVSWRVAAASMAGTSHVASGRTCEDSCHALVRTTPRGSPVLAMFVADGAGSAAFGGEGARLAVDSAAQTLEVRLAQLDGPPDATVMADVLAGVRARIEAASEARARSPRDFACTFLGVLSTPAATLVMQIGDGGIVLDVGEGLELALAPMSGEYANTTRFVTDDDALAAMATRTYPHPALRAAVFSDGMQRLALDIATLRPHQPLFARLFDVMRSVTPSQEGELHAALVRFLDGREVNERTDDDKTLALAVLLP